MVRMRQGHPTFDELIDFQADPVDPEIKKHVDSCERCASMIEGIIFSGGRDDFLVQSEESGNRVFQRLHPKKRTWPGSWYAIAAGIVLVLLAGLLVRDLTVRNHDELVAGYLEEPYPVAYATRGEHNKIWEDFEKAYTSREYSEAAAYLDQLPPSDPREFYLALCRIYQDPPSVDAALKSFTEITMQESRFQQQSRWYLALSYLVVGNMSAAEGVLTEIVRQDGHYMREEAKKLLDLR